MYFKANFSVSHDDEIAWLIQLPSLTLCLKQNFFYLWMRGWIFPLKYRDSQSSLQQAAAAVCGFQCEAKKIALGR